MNLDELSELISTGGAVLVRNETDAAEFFKKIAMGGGIKTGQIIIVHGFEEHSILKDVFPINLKNSESTIKVQFVKGGQ